MRSAILLLLLVGGCRSSSERSDLIPSGHWGGLTLDLNLNDGGGAVVMCCAHAALDQPLRLSANGEFDVTGTVTASKFFAIGRRMRYFGSVSGDIMTLQVETLIPASEAGPGQWFPLLGPEGSDFHYSLRLGAMSTFQHPDGTGACICESPLGPPGIF